VSVLSRTGWMAAWCLAMGLALFASGTQAAVVNATPQSDLSALAGRLKPGDTLLLAPGVYRQTLDVRQVAGTPQNPITIAGDDARGPVILRGSDILKKWEPAGSQLFSHRLDKQPSQVFVNGTALKQVGGTVFGGYPTDPSSEYHRLHRDNGGVWPGRAAPVPPDALPDQAFVYDAAAKRLYVRSSTDLAGATVEASQRDRGLFAEAVSHLRFQGLRVEHANTSVTIRGGAFVVLGHHVQVTRITAQWNDLAGIQLAGDDNRLTDSTASYNGQMGVTARGSRNVIDNVTTDHNNRRGFNKWWEAGGFKFIGDGQGGLKQSVVSRCKALFNQGDGIWFDWKNNDIELKDSLAAYNTGFGIHHEASSGGHLHHNLSIGNGQRGIYLSSSRQTLVDHNLAMGNGLEGIVSILAEGRADDEGVKFKADGNRIQKNVLAWNNEGAIIVPSPSEAQSEDNVFYGDGRSSRFSIDFPSPFNLPVYGLKAWHDKSGQDRRSWWVNKPMPAPWQKYLAARSTDRAPLLELLAQARAMPPADGGITGPDTAKAAAKLSTADVGPTMTGP
jgi:hypothetical protein